MIRWIDLLDWMVFNYLCYRNIDWPSSDKSRKILILHIEVSFNANRLSHEIELVIAKS